MLNNDAPQLTANLGKGWPGLRFPEEGATHPGKAPVNVFCPKPGLRIFVMPHSMTSSASATQENLGKRFSTILYDSAIRIETKAYHKRIAHEYRIAMPIQSSSNGLFLATRSLWPGNRDRITDRSSTKET